MNKISPEIINKCKCHSGSCVYIGTWKERLEKSLAKNKVAPIPEEAKEEPVEPPPTRRNSQATWMPKNMCYPKHIGWLM
jgi:hypothetical protein